MVGISPEEKQEIESLLKEYFTTGRSGGKPPYGIEDNGDVWIQGTCRIKAGKKFDRLPISFGHAQGFNIANCGLITLDGSPKRSTSLDCSNNRLKTLIGSPQELEVLVCENNQLESFVGLAPMVRNIWATGNPIRTFDGISNLDTTLMVDYDSNLPLLRSLKYKALSMLNDVGGQHPTVRILEKYRQMNPTRSDILACQRELIENGFEGNARW